MTPLRAAAASLARTPWSTGLSLALIGAICLALVSGWLGRVAGAAAILYGILPPHR